MTVVVVEKEMKQNGEKGGEEKIQVDSKNDATTEDEDEKLALSKQRIRGIIDSLCFPCTRRLLPFRFFAATSTTANETNLERKNNWDWITRLLAEKRETNANKTEPTGCGVCFGLLEKYSETEYLTKLADEINSSGIQFNDFRIALTLPNVIYMREKYVQLVLDSIPTEHCSTRLYNPKCLTVKEEWKILTFNPLAAIVKKPYNHQSLFDVKICFSLEDSQIMEDVKLLDTRVVPQTERKQRRMSNKERKQKAVQEKGFTKPNVDLLLGQTNLTRMSEFYAKRLPLPFFERMCCSIRVDFAHDPIFLAGRYTKYSRTLSQSRWVIEGVRIAKWSIEEIIGDVLKKKLGAVDYVFTASGREDIDVKCLGDGRPFILEFLESRRTAFSREELDAYTKTINESQTQIQIKDLQQITRLECKGITENTGDKTKCYSARCYCYSKIDQSDIDKLNALTELNLQQKTPVRVLHRRTVLTRERKVWNIKAELVDEHHFMIKVQTQAGTYVKELVHGDLGRTYPNIGSVLGKECDILELDVEAVNCSFPPSLDVKAEPTSMDDDSQKKEEKTKSVEIVA